ncbi:protein kinase domain-containing protein [Streptomyces phaeochromogenes]|uniref:protein kinase domain-containing protein n=1 Tax=Streptomyces phaeochromogenes TaxID=1923 RepID=UPI00386945FF|nr:PQQ-binding-like beta-propeller repeat protein [Streptomyces phaeochromogenes]
MSRFEFGEYRTLVLLGAGGMGRAYLARSGSGRLVVVKVMHAHLAAEPLFRERLRREVQAARAMTGPFTAAVLDAEPQAPLPWLAVEYCAGPTLSEAVAGYGPLAAGDLASLGAALAEALTAIHTAGLVHRDLKPANVLVTGQGPRVIDFGIAKALGDGPASGSSDEALTGGGDMLGSVGFMAPEQITYATEPAASCDVFALGALLALAATGRNPHGGGTAPQIVYRTLHEDPDLVGVPDGEWTAFLTRCLSKGPDERPTAAEVLDWCAVRAAERPWWERPEMTALIEGHEEAVARRIAVSAEADGEGATRIDRPPTPPTSAGPSRRRVLAWAGAAITTAAAATAATIALLGDESGTRRQPVTPSWRSGTPLWTREVGALEYGGALTRTAGALYVRFDGTARRLDPQTGAVAWEFEDASAVLAYGDTVYVTYRRTDVASPAIVAIDAADGTERWRTGALESNPYRPYGFDSPDSGETLLAVTQRTTCLVTFAKYDTLWTRRSNRGQRWRAYGFDLPTGAPLWFRSGTAAQVTALDAAGGRFALASATDTFGPLYVLDERSGEEESSIPEGSATPEVHPGARGTRYYTTQTSVRRVNLATGKARWTRHLADARVVAPLAGDELVVAATANGLGALDTADGDRRWWRDDVRALTTTDGRPLADGTVVYATGSRPGVSGTPAGTSTWGIHALAAATGRLRWAVPVDGLTTASYGAAGDGLIHVCTGTTLQTFRGP